MHEYSLVQSLLSMIESEVKPYPNGKLQSFTVEVGAMSCVEPKCLQGAFEILKLGTPAENAKMKINIVPLLCRCENCAKEYEVKDFNFQCPFCHKGKITIVQGEDTILESLELEEIET